MPSTPIPILKKTPVSGGCGSAIDDPVRTGRVGGASDRQRLEALKATRDCVTYHDAPMVEDRAWNLSLYGNCETGELFVALTQGASNRVCGFMSSSQELTAEERSQGILWPDLVEAFAQARELHRGAPDGGFRL